jgi:hypothetical protein
VVVADRVFRTVRRRQLFVVHPYQREMKTPPWPSKWGEFSLDSFNTTLEPVTILAASRVTGLEDRICPEHGDKCQYTTYPEAEYVVLGGQHRTQEGGRVLGADWELNTAELLSPIALTDLSKPWWQNEQRRAAGSREVFAKRVLDGDPDYVEMAVCLHQHGFDYRRGQHNGRRDFTSIGTLPALWYRDQEAVRIMISLLAETTCETRLPLVRAMFEIAHWDLRDNKGTRVFWTGRSGMPNKLLRLGGKLRQAEQAIGVAGDSAWKRVANTVVANYNKSRQSEDRVVDFPIF